MPKYYLTFGVKYKEEEHPHFPCHPDGWIEIDAQSELDARTEAHNCFGDKWAFLYNEKKFNQSLYPAGRLATIDEVKEQDTENKLFYKKGQIIPKNPVTILSEEETANTLSVKEMMVMNNVSNLMNQISTFPRVDKFHNKIEDCMSNILAGLEKKEGEPDQKDIDYVLGVKSKLDDLIQAIRS